MFIAWILADSRKTLSALDIPLIIPSDTLDVTKKTKLFTNNVETFYDQFY